MIFNQDVMLSEFIEKLLLYNADKEGFTWQVKDQNGGILLKSRNLPENIAPVDIVFPADLPSWTLTLFPENSGLIDSFLRSGEGIFLYIFIAIVVILGFGLFFTLQTVNNEIHLSKMKSYFMSTVSHEFKSPLTSIRQMAEMLVNERVPSREREHKYFATILQQSERLSHLIDNILDFSRMEEGKKNFHFSKGNIIPLVEDIVESFRNSTATMGFEISLAVNGAVPDIVFDPDAMQQVMHNLLDNACKYSGDSKKIDVNIMAKGNEVKIIVRDYGIGITRSDIERIFNRFYRAGDELIQTVKGSGIGLTIVKQIVEAHRGTIDVESEVGKGSIFTVKLPLSRNEP